MKKTKLQRAISFIFGTTLTIFIFSVISTILNQGCSEDANLQAALIDMKAIETAFKMHKLKFDDYPSTAAGIESLVQLRRFPDGKMEQLLPMLPVDPWRNPYVYHYPAIYSKTALWDIYSMGPDGKDDQRTGDDIYADWN